MNEKPEEAQTPGAAVAEDKVQDSRAENGEAEALGIALAEARAEAADLRDKLLRNMAETENFRRRAEREKADVKKYAISEFALDAVSIGDNLRRAIEAANKDTLDQNPALKSLLEGVEVTERELIKVFERHGVTRFDPTGEKFDPHFHEAMIKIDVPNVAADTVVQVLQAGYRIGDRVLRPAAVIVAKGAPMQAAPSVPSGGDAKAHESEAQQSANGPERGASDHGAEENGVSGEARAERSGPSGEGAPGSAPRKEGQGEKRSPSMTKPVTNNGEITKDDLISSFERRFESGN